jgi:hypothetical protein
LKAAVTPSSHVVRNGDAAARAQTSGASSAVIAIVDAILPVDSAGSVRADAVAFAAEFTAAQIAATPTHLRWMLASGLAAFRLVTFVRFGRSIQRLPAPVSRRWVGAWAFGSLGPARLLFRAIRSAAVLAYYERLSETPGRYPQPEA